MKLSTQAFRGEAPRISPRLLPDGMAQQAINCRLLSGDLEAWKNFGTEIALSKTAPINTIYKLGDFWLEWAQSELDLGAVEIDVAKSTIGGDETNRVYLTGLDRPRYTSLPLAVASAGPPFPVETRLLGVIAPDTAPTVLAELGASPPIDISDDFSSTESWTLVPEFVGPFIIRKAEILDTGGNPDDRLVVTAQETTTGAVGAAYAYRDFGLGASGTVEYAFDFRFDALQSPFSEGNAAAYVMCNSSGAGPRIGFGTNGIGIYRAELSLGSVWSDGGSLISVVAISGIPAVGDWARVRITGSRRTNQNYDFRMIVTVGSTDLIDVSFSNVPVSGGYCGHLIKWSLNADRGPIIFSVDNARALGSAPINDPADDVATSYVYTFVNDIGEESAPSPASSTIFKDDGTTITVTTPTAPPSGLDYRVETKRIYRAVTTATVTTFLFVAEIALTQADYVDTLTDDELGEELESDDWDLPPENLRGILALPNDVYAGFTVNQLCFSVQGRPHAWPVRFRLNTDFPIVAIGNVDTTVIAATEKFPYLATGNAPDAYSMTKLELPQSCVSKRGTVYLRGWGWCYPSPDGMVAIAGTGQARIITEQLFSRKEWQAINPSTLIAREHDDRLFAFYVKADGTKEGMMIEAKEQGFGKVTLAFHATAMHVDPVTDQLYLVLDENNPPTTHGTPNTNQVVPDGETIYIWDAYEGGSAGLTPLLPYYWKGRLDLLPAETCFKVCAIDAMDYDDLTAVFFADGGSIHTEQVIDDREFLLPPTDATTFEIALSGTSRVHTHDVAEDVDELVR